MDSKSEVKRACRKHTEQRRILDPPSKVQFGKEVSQIPFEGWRQGGIEGPLTADFVERNVAEVVGDEREACGIEERERALLHDGERRIAGYRSIDSVVPTSMRDM